MTKKETIKPMSPKTSKSVVGNICETCTFKTSSEKCLQWMQSYLTEKASSGEAMKHVYFGMYTSIFPVLLLTDPKIQ